MRFFFELLVVVAVVVVGIKKWVNWIFGSYIIGIIHIQPNHSSNLKRIHEILNFILKSAISAGNLRKF